MCVSYRKLKIITWPFQYPIPRFDAEIDILGLGSILLFRIDIDDRQGYHKIAVQPQDQEKLEFFAPDDEKYYFTVMPFGPTNAPKFYSAMINKFKDEWDQLFLSKVNQLKKYQKHTINASSSGNFLCSTYLQVIYFHEIFFSLS